MPPTTFSCDKIDAFHQQTLYPSPLRPRGPRDGAQGHRPTPELHHREASRGKGVTGVLLQVALTDASWPSLVFRLLPDRKPPAIAKDADWRNGGDATRRDLVEQRGRGLLGSLSVLTPSRGTHHYFGVPPARSLKVGNGLLGPGCGCEVGGPVRGRSLSKAADRAHVWGVTSLPTRCDPHAAGGDSCGPAT